MVDPLEGLKSGSVYRLPANALVEHPGLLLIVGGLGLGLVFATPALCISEFNPSQCRANLEPLGWGIAGMGLLSYAIVRYRRLATDPGD